MRIDQVELNISCKNLLDLLDNLAACEFPGLPIRFAVTDIQNDQFKCEVGYIEGAPNCTKSVFNFRERYYVNREQFNLALIIPTGLGFEFGGHSGDGCVLSRLFAPMCDNLITHPNVVNAADINEMPKNTIYVEGSALSRLLMGMIVLQKTNRNKLLTLFDKHEDQFFNDSGVNSVNAARVTLGLDCKDIRFMDETAKLNATFSGSGRAIGCIEDLDNIIDHLTDIDEFDAVAISTLINVPNEFHMSYFAKDAKMANPWGGVEALLTHALSLIFDKQFAHSPMMNNNSIMNINVGVTDPRKAAEVVSTTFLHCILKGLHNAPKIRRELNLIGKPGMIAAEDVSCIVMPYNCLGIPVLAAIKQNIDLILVCDEGLAADTHYLNLTKQHKNIYYAQNYPEAAGIAQALKNGIDPNVLYRPIRA